MLHVLPHMPAHSYRDLGIFVDIAQLILMVAVTYVLSCLVRMMRQVQAVASFWVKRWNELPPLGALGGLTAIDTRKVIEEAARDHQVPNASNGHDQSTGVVPGCGEGFPRAL
jgi:hypothetical protein